MWDSVPRLAGDETTRPFIEKGYERDCAARACVQRTVELVAQDHEAIDLSRAWLARLNRNVP